MTALASGERGVTLVEVAVALSVFTLLALSVSMTLVRGEDHRRSSFDMYRAMQALRDRVAEIQNTANLPQNLAAQEGIGAVYARYNGQTFNAPSLSSGQITIQCFPDEASVPGELGGPQDLNFDGDAQDDHGGLANGTDLKLVPMRLTLTFDDDGVTQTLTLHRLMTKTTN